tara:strand:+ start:51 stop:194 length:144 start_codon:yes stop_codon:yes gene_type:complete
MSKKRATKSGTSFAEAREQAKDYYTLTARNLRRLALKNSRIKNNAKR